MLEKPTQSQIVEALGLKKKGREYAGPCPLCGGTDRFHVREDGVFGCRGCGDENKKALFKTVLDRCGVSNGGGDSYTPRPQNEDGHTKSKPAKKPYKPSASQGYKSLPDGPNVTHHEYDYTFTVVRHDLDSGKKSVRPWIRKEDGKWYSKRPEGGKLLPLYGHYDLMDWEDRPVVVVEGEKCRDALWGALGQGNEGRLPVSYAFGSEAWDKTDWSPVAGRDVLLLSDADAPGRKNFAALGQYLKSEQGCEVSVAFPDGDTGEDVADWLMAEGSKATFRKIRELTQPFASIEGSIEQETVRKMSLHEAVEWSVIRIISQGSKSGVCCVEGTLYVCNPDNGLWIEMASRHSDWSRYAAALYSVVVGNQYHSMVTAGRRFIVSLRDTLDQKRGELTQVRREEWNRTTLNPLLPLTEGGCWHLTEGKVLTADEVRPLYIEQTPIMRPGPTPRHWDPEQYADQERGSVWLSQWGNELVTRFARNLVYGPAKHFDIVVAPTSNWGKGALMDTAADAFPGLVTQSDPMTLRMPAGGRFDTLREKLAWAHVVFTTEVRDHEITSDRIVAVTETKMEFERKGLPEEQKSRKGTLMLLNTEDVNIDFEMQGIVNRTPWILDISDDERTMSSADFLSSCTEGNTQWFRDYVCHLVMDRASLEASPSMLDAANRYRAKVLKSKEDALPEELKALRALYEYTGRSHEYITHSDMRTEMAGYMSVEEEDLPKNRAWTKMLRDAFPSAHKVEGKKRRIHAGVVTVHEGFIKKS